MEEAREYRVKCAHFGEPGHEFHKFPKVTEAKAVQTAIDRNFKADLDARRPESKRYMDHKCAPYTVEYRSLMDWTVVS